MGLKMHILEFPTLPLGGNVKMNFGIALISFFSFSFKSTSRQVKSLYRIELK